MSSDFYLPYLLDYSNLAAEDVVIFVIAVLTAIIVSAEGQAFVAAFLGDMRPGTKDRFHFNAFLHMSVMGTVSFLVAGFGWVKEIKIDETKFNNHPKLFLIISRLAGPVANILMANIAASLAWIIGNFGFVDKVFSMMVVVNVTMAIYSLLIIPPLPGAALLYAVFPDNAVFVKIKKNLPQIGTYTIVAVFAFIRFSGWDGISNVMNPIVLGVTEFLLDF